MRFFRVQSKGISFEEMINWNSDDGGDGETVGLAVSGSANGIDGGARFGGAWEAVNDDDELIVLEGRILAGIYDGYRIQPTREIARFTIAEWKIMLDDGTAWDWES
jgi:hypothetical protein